ncbi:MAG: tetratricopeptide repeat protein [Alphaproteobacteria bacterium]|nr:tetratricopeptide repeat protein [Alphaproteobacteria bacterium]
MGNRDLYNKNKRLSGVAGALSFAIFALSDTSATAQSIGSAADALVCQRNVQSNERLQRIPQGLLAAISLVESGRGVGPGGSTVAWPWTINAAGEGQYFDTKEEAIAATRQLIEDGLRSIDIGCMQINLRYHPDAFASIEQAFDPARNVAYGASYLRQLHRLQGSWPKAVERYHSSEDGRRAEYREKVISTWRDDARRLIMNAVLAEDTDTPYHRAVKDFAAGRYEASLKKYQEILKDKADDRLALLGIAMASDRLGRVAESAAAYDQFLINEPENPAILSRVLEYTAVMTPNDAIARLERLANSGVDEPSLLATLGDLKGKLGQTESALSYMGAAIQRAPDIALYHLNAGVLADRLDRPGQAVAYYGEFIRLFELQPVFIDTSVDGVRERARYLRARL